MSIEDTIGSQNEVPSCAVCGKNITHGGGFSRINHNGVAGGSHRLGWSPAASRV
jgi:hypothetical protein